MNSRKLRIGFVMDPLAGIDIDKDTTFVFIEEAGARGHECFYLPPEKLSIRPPGMPAAAMANRLGGTVRRASFLGNIVRYAVERAGGALVTVDAPNLSSGHHTGPGDAVTLDWSPADSAILSSDAP